MPQVAAIGVRRAPLGGVVGAGAAPERRLPDAPAPAALEALEELGRRTRSHAWPVGADLADARNAHATNRASELRRALLDGSDWLEVDVRRIRGELVASHDRTPTADALRMRDWIRIGAQAHRGLKLDFKERDAIAPTLDLVAAAGVPDARLVVNVPVLADGGLTLAQLRRIRARFPGATINLCLGPRVYSSARLRAAVTLARQVGGPVAFPLDLARVDRPTVRALRAGGRVAIWNDPRRTPVRDLQAARHALRRWGVDGTIDLR